MSISSINSSSWIAEELKAEIVLRYSLMGIGICQVWAQQTSANFLVTEHARRGSVAYIREYCLGISGRWNRIEVSSNAFTFIISSFESQNPIHIRKPGQAIPLLGLLPRRLICNS